MKWPWVSRELFDAELAIARVQVKAADARAAYAELRFADLLEKFTALRVQGAVPEPKQAIGLAATVQQQADELRDLIESRSAGNLRVRGMMLRQLERDRADNLDPDTIRQRIESGVESSGVPT